MSDTEGTTPDELAAISARAQEVLDAGSDVYSLTSCRLARDVQALLSAVARLTQDRDRAHAEADMWMRQLNELTKASGVYQAQAERDLAAAREQAEHARRDRDEYRDGAMQLQAERDEALLLLRSAARAVHHRCELGYADIRRCEDADCNAWAHMLDRHGLLPQEWGPDWATATSAPQPKDADQPTDFDPVTGRLVPVVYPPAAAVPSSGSPDERPNVGCPVPSQNGLWCGMVSCRKGGCQVAKANAAATASGTASSGDATADAARRRLQLDEAERARHARDERLSPADQALLDDVATRLGVASSEQAAPVSAASVTTDGEERRTCRECGHTAEDHHPAEGSIKPIGCQRLGCECSFTLLGEASHG